MIVSETRVRGTGRQHSLEGQARALAVVLREEFGTPFSLFEAETGTLIDASLGEAETGSKKGAPAPLSPEIFHELVTTGRAVVLPNEKRYQLGLLLYQNRKPVLVAVAEWTPCTHNAADSQREQGMLEKWLQAVSDRLRLSDQLAPRRSEEQAGASAPSTLPWEALLALDGLARRTRLHKDLDRNCRRVLETAFGLVSPQALVWVPRDSDAQVIVQGEQCIAPADCRQLAGMLSKSQDYRPGSPILYERFQEKSGAGRFPQIFTLLALPVTDQGLVGWVVAINKRGPRGAQAAGDSPALSFRKSDAALLTPFVALLELHARGSARYQDLKELLVGLTRSLTTAIDAKDSYTFGHSERVARIAVELGRELGMEGDDLGDIYLAGLLHDIGKIGVRDEVLRKPERLTPEEQDHIRQHVTIGYAILSELRQIRNLLPGVLYHHERYDGGGYPDGLAGENIPLLARILAVADSYDAMTTARPYRDPMPWNTVEHILMEGAGEQWDKRVVDAFMRCRQKVHTIRQRGVGESLRMALDGALRSSQFSQRGFLPPPSEQSK